MMSIVKTKLIISSLLCILQAITSFNVSAQFIEKANLSFIELVGEGTISTSKSEYKSVVYQNGKKMIFTRSDDDYKNQTIMISELIDGKWGVPALISFSDILYNDSDPYITPSGETVYFVSNRPKTGILPQSNLDLWKSDFSNGVWKKPVPLEKTINSDYNEFGPFIFKNKLYFNSYRDSGSGYLDLFYSEIKEGKFMPPVNLGKDVNSDLNEFDPVISPNGRYLVFSSWRKNGSLGKSDIYISVRQNESWSKPLNAGPLVNSAFEDNSPVFSEDGEYLYISSSRYDNSKPIETESILNGSFNIYRLPSN
jgi:hypothetical protein